MSIKHCMPPIVLVPYNLSSWMNMKQAYTMMYLITPEPLSLDNHIDVYLRPLIEELKGYGYTESILTITQEKRQEWSSQLIEL